MKKLLQKLSVSALGLTMLALPLALPAVAHAQTGTTNPDPQGSLCQGANLQVGGSTDCATNGNPESTVNNIIANVINIFSLIVGVVSVIMIIVGGLKYITSGGDSGNVSGAKNTILYAIVGLVVVALAQIIVKFVLQRVGNAAN